MTYNIGILIHGDPTRRGTIMSEVKFLNNLHENNADCDFFIIVVNGTLHKKISKDKQTYSFPHKILDIHNESDFHKLSNLSCVITYPSHSNFFGGYLNSNEIMMYKIVSKCTNDLDIPAFIRVNDSEIKVRDYRKMSEIRLEDGINKPESAFMKDPLNVQKARDLVECKQWNYDKIHWFANGSRESCDWLAETLYDREDELYRMASRNSFVDKTIYVSDDIFFLVRKNYEKFSTRYETHSSTVVSGGLIPPGVIGGHGLKIWNGQDTIKSDDVKNSLCYIGFFDTVNIARAKAFNSIFANNSCGIPMKIFGKGTEILKKLQGKSNIEIEEGYIKGDSDEYFDFLHSHLGYIFVGKGQSHSRYIGKTVYDAIVARTPVLVYKKCDSGHITFKSDEFYFNDERELNDKFNLLQDKTIRDRWIREQTEDIFDKLPPSKFKFSEYCDKKESIEVENENHDTVMAIHNTSVIALSKFIEKEHKPKSTPLF